MTDPIIVAEVRCNQLRRFCYSHYEAKPKSLSTTLTAGMEGHWFTADDDHEIDEAPPSSRGTDFTSLCDVWQSIIKSRGDLFSSLPVILLRQGSLVGLFCTLVVGRL